MKTRVTISQLYSDFLVFLSYTSCLYVNQMCVYHTADGCVSNYSKNIDFAQVMEWKNVVHKRGKDDAAAAHYKVSAVNEKVL